MLRPLIYAGLVPLSLILFYIALPLWATRKSFRGCDLLDRCVLALLLGLSSQAALGTLWQVVVPGYPFLNALVYVIAWISVAWWGRSRAVSDWATPFSRKEKILWIGVLVFGFASRLIHPMETVALGQSDAYTHLYMLRQLVESEAWASSYPPAFSRILLLPCVCLNIDPYEMARFGGSFFGVGLALSAAWMVRRCSGSPTAALLTATLLCCFPGFNLLMKTGVGAFPNQVGLLLIPYLIAGLCDSQRSPATFWLGGWACLGLALVVPMMLIHLCLIGSSAVVLWRIATRNPPSKNLWIGCLAGMVISILGIFLLQRIVPQELISSQVRVFVSGGETADGVQGLQLMSFAEGIQIVLRDFFSVKRVGLGSLFLNSALGVLAVSFCAICGFGWKHKMYFAIVLGCWGSITLLQTATGFAQFTAYQREGWSLMLATAVMGGWLGSLLLKHVPLTRFCLVPAIGVLAVSSILLPPRHSLRNSTTEEEWVSLARWLPHQSGLAPEAPLYDLTQELRASINPEESLFVVTRPLLQNAMFEAVVSKPAWIRYSDLNIWQTYEEVIPSAIQVLLLLDPRPTSSAGSGSPFASVSPEALAMFEEQESRSHLFNQTLETFVLGMDPATFEVRPLAAPSGMRAYFIRKKSIDVSGDS